MLEILKDKIFHEAIARWGIINQVFMVMEECGELLNVLAKAKRERSTPEEIITELADVSIMCDQMAHHFGKEAFLKEKERKLIRLKSRVFGEDVIELEPQVYHLLVTKICSHKCPLCCNNLYDLDKLPVITTEELANAHTVCITGGEPFYLGDRLVELCKKLRQQFSIKKLYVYSSGSHWNDLSLVDWRVLFNYIDGINIAPKSAYEWNTFSKLIMSSQFPQIINGERYSNRLYVFDDQWESWEITKCKQGFILPQNFQVIGRKWDKKFNTPPNEHFVRLPILY